jgi:hypothetical protein
MCFETYYGILIQLKYEYLNMIVLVSYSVLQEFGFDVNAIMVA